MLTVVRDLPTLLDALDPHAVERTAAEMRVTEISIGTERFRCHSLGDLRLISDSCGYRDVNAVFPLHPESLLLSLLIQRAAEDSEFLDVGCGSGILPILAARKGWRTTAIDVNPRALAFAATSAALNGCTIQLQERDIRTFNPQRRFDFITLNLPFEPTGGVGQNFVHSDGGRLGHELNIAAASRLSKLLSKSGIAVMMAFSLQKGGRSSLEDWLQTSFLKLSPTLIRLSPEIPTRTLLLRYGKRIGDEIYRVLESDGYTSFFIEIVVFRNSAVARPLQVLNSLVASEEWIYPLGEHALTRAPSQDSSR